MNRADRLDSPSFAVRALERCKRGATASIIVALFGLLAWLAYGLTSTAMEAVGASSTTQIVVAFAVATCVATWCLGNRRILRTIGDLAAVADHAAE